MPYIVILDVAVQHVEERGDLSCRASHHGI